MGPMSGPGADADAGKSKRQPMREGDERDVRRLLATVEVRCEALVKDALRGTLVECVGHGDRVNYMVDTATRTHCPVCSVRQQREVSCRGHLGCLANHSPGRGVESSLANGGSLMIVKSVGLRAW